MRPEEATSAWVESRARIRMLAARVPVAAGTALVVTDMVVLEALLVIVVGELLIVEVSGLVETVVLEFESEVVE